jgi:hypothetical protein
MKALKSLILLITTIVLMSACSNDNSDGDNENPSAELVGSWQLIEVNVSKAIDTNDDGTTTTNLLTEVDCLRDTLTLSNDDIWSSSGVFPSLISPITGDLYNVSCSATINRSGTWEFSGSSLFLTGDFQATFLFDGSRLTLPIGNELPGLQSLVYEKQ